MTTTRKPESAHIDSGHTGDYLEPRICEEKWTGPFSNNSSMFRVMSGRTYEARPAAVGGGQWPITNYYAGTDGSGPDSIHEWHQNGFASMDAAKAAAEAHAAANPAV